MGLEAATFIHELVSTNPVGATDPKSQGDDHLRLIKTTLLNTFANVDGAVTSSHTELNILDGVTATAAELNILDGVTSSTAELNILDGVTATAAELNITDGLIASTAELNFVDGATSNIQAQLNAEVARVTSGTFSPAATAGANCTVSSVGVHQFQRIGNTVFVSGIVNISVTTGSGVSTSFTVALPVASNFTTAAQASGVGTCDISNSIRAFVQSNAALNELQVNFFSTSSGGQGVYYQAQYQVV
jgi:hypothetical protein